MRPLQSKILDKLLLLLLIFFIGLVALVLVHVFFINLEKKLDGKFPWNYLGKSLGKILEPLEMTTDEFITICDEFTNKRIFVRDNQGKLTKDKNGNLTKVNYENL